MPPGRVLLIGSDEDVAIRRVTGHFATWHSDTRTPFEAETAVALACTSFGTTRIRPYVPVLMEREAGLILCERRG